ncbi:MAG TPA: hypothetical protein O0X39_03550 [Methanocorpusculum sp.]|nr:hypothetical protein [Methanocorpusculum sp.]
MHTKKTNHQRHISLLIPWLTEQIQNGKTYFKSSEISTALPLTLRQVASCLPALAADTRLPLTVTRWGSPNSTTWKIILREPRTTERTGRQTTDDTTPAPIPAQA